MVDTGVRALSYLRAGNCLAQKITIRLWAMVEIEIKVLTVNCSKSNYIMFTILLSDETFTIPKF